MEKTITVGLLADTHIPHRMARLPDRVLHALAGVDVVLHAGDVDDPATLAPLRDVAPVYAVRGNIHLQDFSNGGAALPLAVELDLAGYHIVLTHGHRPGLLGFGLRGRDVMLHMLRVVPRDYMNEETMRYLLDRFPQADIIVFGHTHEASIRRIGSTWLVNPGAVCPTRHKARSVARLYLRQEQVGAEFVPLA